MIYKITLKLLTIPAAKNIIIMYDQMLVKYRYKCIIIDKYISIALSIIISIVYSYIIERSYIKIFYSVFGAVEFSRKDYIS